MSKPIHRSGRRRGNAAVETAVIFFPLMFMVLSTFELGRGMWMYHTLTTALKSGARYAMVHGSDCLGATSKCAAAVSDVSGTIRRAGVGLDSDKLQLTLVSAGASYLCGTLSKCMSDSTQWPPSSGNRPGSSITLQATYTFQSVLSSFWPGQGQALKNYAAAATEVMEF